MLEPTLAGALNNQYNFERFSEAVYVALAGKLDNLNLVGMASYLRKRAGEEHSHAEKFAEFIIDRNGVLVVDALEKPEPLDQADPMQAGLEAFSRALEHEHKVTARIEALYQIGLQIGDFRECEFLHWFLKEQTEEERSLEEIITRFKLAAGNGAAILQIDHWLGE